MMSNSEDKIYVGVDVSKSSLDLYIHSVGRLMNIPNDEAPKDEMNAITRSPHV